MIPLITNDPDGQIADNKDITHKMLKAITNQLHEKGLVVAVIPKGIVRELDHILINNPTARQHELDNLQPSPQRTVSRKRLAYAIRIREIIRHSQPHHNNQRNANPQRNLCHSSINPAYFKSIMTDKDAKNPNIYIAFHYSRGPRKPAATRRRGSLPQGQGPTFDHRVAALTAWQTLQPFYVRHDEYPTLRIGVSTEGILVDITRIAINRIVRPNLLTSYENGKIALLDLVCACDNSNTNPYNVNVVGAGTDMFLFTLAKIAKARQAGARRYDAVITYLASDGPGNYPLQRMVELYGFQMCRLKLVRYDNLLGTIVDDRHDIYPYYILCDRINRRGEVVTPWEQALAERVPDPEPACPLDTRTNRPQCL